MAMTEKDNFSQLELFAQKDKSQQLLAQERKPFLAYLRRYESIILLSIGFLTTGIIAFCIGVEKGKNMATAKTNLYLDIADKAKTPVTAPSIPRAEKREALQVPEYINNWTVQVASYKTKINAQQEANSLKKKGFSPVVVNKGNYVIVCVGNFTKKEMANSLMLELQKKYKGCYLRRL